MIRGLGTIGSVDDIRKISLGVDANGAPILLKDVARVGIGPEMRRGIAEWNGEGETVGGIVVVRHGAGTLRVIQDVKAKLEEVKAGLPQGVEVKVGYDRTALIERSVASLRTSLLQQLLIVGLVSMVFLLHFRSGLVAVVSLPVGILMAFLVMSLQGINVNIMSLGGIAVAIGTMVDASIVMVENAHRHLARNNGERDHWAVIAQATKEVGPTLFFALLVITVSFLPVFALEAQEGRLFKPLAYAKTYAMAAAALLAVTLVPVLVGFWVRGRISVADRNPFSRVAVEAGLVLFAFSWLVRPLLNAVFRFKFAVLGLAALALAVTAIPLSRIGSEFMPTLWEGDLLYMPTTLPGISVTKAGELLQQTDRIIRTFPEVENVFGKVGRADTATDPAPLSMIETTIMLKPKSEWRPGMTPEKLADEMNAAIDVAGTDQRLDDAHPNPHRHALHRHQDPRRDQDCGPRPRGTRTPRQANRGRGARSARDSRCLRGTGHGRRLSRRHDRPRRHRPLRPHDSRRPGRHSDRHWRHEHHHDDPGAGAASGQPALQPRVARRPAGAAQRPGSDARRAADTPRTVGEHRVHGRPAQHQERRRQAERLGVRRHPGCGCRRLRRGRETGCCR